MVLLEAKKMAIKELKTFINMLLYFKRHLVFFATKLLISKIEILSLNRRKIKKPNPNKMSKISGRSDPTQGIVTKET